MATVTAPDSRSSRHAAVAAEFRHGLPVETRVLGCTLLLWIALAVASPYFLTTGNAFNIMRQVSVDAIVAYGELFGVSSFWQMVIEALLIEGVVYLDNLQKRKAQGR